MRIVDRLLAQIVPTVPVPTIKLFELGTGPSSSFNGKYSRVADLDPHLIRIKRVAGSGSAFEIRIRFK